MEIIFSNLQDDLVYHANIFNYDKTFFNELCSKNLKLDFSNFSLQNQEDVPVVIQFLKQKSKEQVSQFDTLALEQEENMYNEEEGEPIVRVSKEAKKTVRVILSLAVYSFDKFLKDQEHMQQMMESGVQESNSNGDNLTCCLLYLDGICMVNIDLIKTVTLLCPDAGKEFYAFLNEIMTNKYLSIQTKEIASHLFSMSLMMAEGNVEQQCIDLINWTFNHSIGNKRDNCLTSNLSLILTIDSCLEYFTTTFDDDKKCIRQLFELMLTETNINTIYESLFCMWNLSNNKQFLSLLEKKNENYIEKIVQVIRTNKIDKVARIGLMTIKNLLDSQVCLEILFNIKFMRTIDILLTNKWNDPVIKELLNFIYDFLEKNYKIMNSFDKFVKELDSGNLKQGSLHSTAFWEENYKEFEANQFDNIRKLVCIVQSAGDTEEDIKMKCIACFDLGEFARLYPGGASILDIFGAKESLLLLIQHKNLELKNKALVCLQKIMMRSLKK